MLDKNLDYRNQIKDLKEEIKKLQSKVEKLEKRNSWKFNNNISLKDETFRKLRSLIERNSGESKVSYRVEFI